ncbi:unnamed protein product, partial [Ectocarpus fasciculatus]
KGVSRPSKTHQNTKIPALRPKTDTKGVSRPSKTHQNTKIPALRPKPYKKGVSRPSKTHRSALPLQAEQKLLSPRGHVWRGIGQQLEWPCTCPAAAARSHRCLVHAPYRPSSPPEYPLHRSTPAYPHPRSPKSHPTQNRLAVAPRPRPLPPPPR